MEKLAVLRWTIRTRDGGSRLNSFGKFYYVAANRQGISMVYQPKLIPTLFWAQWPIKAPCLFIRIQCVKTKNKKQKTKRDCAQPFFYLLFEHRAFNNNWNFARFFYADNPINCSSDICSTGELSRIFQFLYITSCRNTLRIVYQHGR